MFELEPPPVLKPAGGHDLQLNETYSPLNEVSRKSSEEIDKYGGNDDYARQLAMEQNQD